MLDILRILALRLPWLLAGMTSPSMEEALRGGTPFLLRPEGALRRSDRSESVVWVRRKAGPVGPRPPSRLPVRLLPVGILSGFLLLRAGGIS